MLLWLAILALAAFGLIKLIDRRSSTRSPRRAENTTFDGGSRPLDVRDLGSSALVGIAGSLVSIGAGVFVAALTMDPDQGATFVAIWFWLAGPPVSAVVMAVVVRFRHWDPPAVGVRAVVAFTVCLLCGFGALGVAGSRSSAPPSVDHPPTTDLGPATSVLPSSTAG